MRGIIYIVFIVIPLHKVCIDEVVIIFPNRIAVIPAYEPDEKLISLVEETTDRGFYTVVVDDGSGYAYENIFEKVKAYAQVISYGENHGKGYALKKAYSYIKDLNLQGNHSIVVLDCDGQHRVSDAIKLCKRVEECKDILVLGSRKQSRSSPLRSRFGNAVTRNVFKLATGTKIYDTQTGLRAFDISLLDKMLSIVGNRYEYEINVLLILAKEKFPIEEIEIETIYIDNNSGSHFNPIKDSIRIYKEIIKFSLSSFVCFLIDYLAYTLFLILLGETYALVANVLARLISATVNFNLNRVLVFKSQGNVVKSAIKYILLAVGILICNTVILYILTTILKLNPYVSKVLTEMVLFFFSWLIQQRVVFNN